MNSEIKDSAIVIRSVDVGEGDKLLTLFSLENGKFQAKIRGVKKPKAKLVFAAQPFCFGEYIFNKSKGFYTVINCNAIDNFFSITTDLNKFYAGSTILEVVNILSRPGEKNLKLFLLTLRALKALAYKGDNLLFILSKFFIEAMEVAGYKLALSSTSSSSGYFSFDTGAFVSKANAGENFTKLSKSTAECLRSVSNADFEDTDKLYTGIKNVFRLLIVYFEDKTDERLECPKAFF